MADRTALATELFAPFSSANDEEPVNPIEAFEIAFNTVVDDTYVELVEQLYDDVVGPLEGYVYVFRWTRAPPGVLKIGASYEHDARMTAWRRSLGARRRELQQFAHVYTRHRELAEGVVHALLDSLALRTPIANARERRTHEEFFRIDDYRALLALVYATARHVSWHVANL